MKFVYTSKQEDEYTNIGSLFHIKVDGVTLHDYTHFKDYHRGYAYGYGYSRTYTQDEQMYYHTPSTTNTVNECHFDFLTIPFAKSIEIGFLNDYELRTNSIEGDIASVVVWQDED